MARGTIQIFLKDPRRVASSGNLDPFVQGCLISSWAAISNLLGVITGAGLACFRLSVRPFSLCYPHHSPLIYPHPKFTYTSVFIKGFPGDSVHKRSRPQCRRQAGSIPGSGRSPGEGNGYPLRYSCLQNFMGRGDRRATKSQRPLTDWHIPKRSKYTQPNLCPKTLCTSFCEVPF